MTTCITLEHLQCCSGVESLHYISVPVIPIVTWFFFLSEVGLIYVIMSQVKWVAVLDLSLPNSFAYHAWVTVVTLTLLSPLLRHLCMMSSCIWHSYHKSVFETAVYTVTLRSVSIIAPDFIQARCGQQIWKQRSSNVLWGARIHYFFCFHTSSGNSM